MILICFAFSKSQCKSMQITIQITMNPLQLDGQTYEVEKITSKFETSKGVVYEVHWKNYKRPTFEPPENLSRCFLINPYPNPRSQIPDHRSQIPYPNPIPSNQYHSNYAVVGLMLPAGCAQLIQEFEEREKQKKKKPGNKNKRTSSKTTDEGEFEVEKILEHRGSE